ncbi:uncharacterized protein DEA37_0013333 [Paragonimus westermani]|uniref:UPAR/Ly6 domain-containing protein qvr n=1 Tax=Paragonimus westermani TaxID=34504 RepID=A0A5J4NMT6_9TREM|nr:uncharacterized protein DEA37_0013333 [Paragonimus westermani]
MLAPFAVESFFWLSIFGQLVQSADPDHCPGQRIHCYSCDSLYNPECNDPFSRHNQPPKSVSLVDCNAFCFKWAVKTDDHKRMIRNCSTALNTKMEKYLVCITESRSDFGFLCFCNKDKCNHTINLRHYSLAIPLMMIISCLLSVVDL